MSVRLPIVLAIFATLAVLDFVGGWTMAKKGQPFTIWLRGGKKCRAARDKRGRVRFWVCHWKKDDAHG